MKGELSSNTPPPSYRYITYLNIFNWLFLDSVQYQGFPDSSVVKDLRAMQEAQVPSLG